MMKNLSWLCLFLLVSSGYGQECVNQRYNEETFVVDLSTGIKFGEAPQPTLLNPNNIQELYMNVYQPSGDTLRARPLIVWAFGGGFVFGSRSSPDIVALSDAFTKRGYVNAAIDYRLSPSLLVNSDTATFYEALLKAIHDMRASIRYFYKDAATSNTYRIDTTRIYIGGVSAGAITALHIAHFDELSEVPAEIDSVFHATGGFAGQSGNEGYGEDIAGVINLCGAIGDTAWMNAARSLPIVSMHGTDDDVVPYGTDTVTLYDIGIVVDGSASIHHKLEQGEIDHDLYTFQGAGHTPFVLNQDYMDTTIWFVRDFLYDLVCDGLTSAEAPAFESRAALSIYPNPNNGTCYISLDGGEGLALSVLDAYGREVYTHPKMLPGLHRLELNLPPGVYTVYGYADPMKWRVAQKIVVQ